MPLEGAVVADDRQRARAFVRQFLRSHQAKLAAVTQINREKGSPFNAARLQEIAASIDPWEPSTDPVREIRKPKRNGQYRTVYDFSFKDRATAT